MRLSAVAISSLALGLCGSPAFAFTPPNDGLFAVFDTSAGEFAARLDYEAAPLTVANFVRLAEGSIPTMDLTSGEVQLEPFYDGITFHRVVPGFVIQAGSPNGEGTDGPGYVVPDEFVAGQEHVSAGILSMANSGPNSNGSQFFVTLDATPSLDWRHSVFGAVVEGIEVVNAIGSGALVAGTDDQPVVPVTINAVSIVRQGTAANAWDDSAPVLPVMSYNPMTIEPAAEASRVELFFTRRPFTRNYLSTTTDFKRWRMLGSRGETLAGPVVESFIREDVPNNGGRLYRATEDQKILPVDMTGKSIRFNPPEFLPSYTVNFGASFAGTYTHTDTAGNDYAGTLTYRWYKHENVDVVHLIFDLNLITYRDGTGKIVYVPNQPQQVSLFFNPGSLTDGSFTVHYYRPTSDWNAYPDLVLEDGVFLLTGP